MDRFARFIVGHKKSIVIVFAVAAIICAGLMTQLKVNYNMVDYLPQNAQSTQALDIMNEEFTEALPNANVMVKGVTITEALAYKEKLESIDSVGQVIWLDDVVDVKQPLETLDSDTVTSYYKEGNALFSVSIESGRESEGVNDIRELIGDGNAISGNAVDLDFAQSATGTETVNAALILVPVIVILLILATTSWLEPLLFLLAIGVSVLINMGTSVFFGEVSFMTFAVTPILQLAVSLDYAIVLMHSFTSFREKYPDAHEAMRHAIVASVKTVSSSAAATMVGFTALIFMEFGIGADLGASLARGILFSFISVMLFLPALTLFLYKGVDKLQHRPFMPSFKGIGRVTSKLAIPAVLIIAIMIVPAYLGQGKTDFIYGNQSTDPENPVTQSRLAIEEEFGESTMMVLLVPRGEVSNEAALSRDLEALDHVTSVMSYATTVGTAIPPEFLSSDVTERFYSDNYARIIVTTDTPQEGAVAFATVERITDTAKQYYGDAVYSVGQSANLYDMKQIVKSDDVRVNLIAIALIFFVLLITFRSFLLPFLLLITIQAGIWINLSIPYFTGTSTNFIGYLVLSSVQLGATIDYAILLTVQYIKRRKEAPKKEALRLAVGDSFKPILVSAAILSVTGFSLFLTSSNPSLSDVGLLLGRGALIAIFLVSCFLPALLWLFDKAIAKTTYKAGFFEKPREKEGVLS